MHTDTLSTDQNSNQSTVVQMSKVKAEFQNSTIIKHFFIYHPAGRNYELEERLTLLYQELPLLKMINCP